VPYGRPIRARVEAGRRAVVGERAALVVLGALEAVRADDHVRVAVTVHVARRRDGDAEAGLALIALGSPRGHGAKPRRRTEIPEGAALADLSRVVGGGADDDVAEA